MGKKAGLCFTQPRNFHFYVVVVEFRPAYAKCPPILNSSAAFFVLGSLAVRLGTIATLSARYSENHGWYTQFQRRPYAFHSHPCIRARFVVSHIFRLRRERNFWLSLFFIFPGRHIGETHPEEWLVKSGSFLPLSPPLPISPLQIPAQIGNPFKVLIPPFLQLDVLCLRWNGIVRCVKTLDCGSKSFSMAGRGQWVENMHLHSANTRTFLMKFLYLRAQTARDGKRNEENRFW